MLRVCAGKLTILRASAALCLSLCGGATLAQAYGSAPLRSPDKAFTPPSGIPACAALSQLRQP
ncbi:hypothetical protein J4734_28810 [Klebsiella pneumoniae]|uniref:Uncharacterized protein n=1 Tax=Klebsiella pneumoniae TaxID=573 RepID=A0A939NQE3_KLEPN|nr:hypothetical protein [Klebsiella pneumoniae]